MPRFIITLTEAQLDDLRSRFPGQPIKEQIYRALGFDPPGHGGSREGAGRKNMITVLSASYLRGYSGQDHLLDDDDLSDIVGRQYNSVAEAQRAAHKLKQWGVPVALEIQFASGEIRTV